MIGKKLPSIQTMRALEAVARLGSFTAAADQLALSQGAISQHIRGLERRLGRSLFRRTSVGVEPTELAQTLAVQVRQGLGLLDRAFEQQLFSEGTNQAPIPKKRLVVSVLPAFAAKWLLPRIERFSRLYPYIDLEIVTSGSLAKMDAIDGVDAAIRYGPGGWPGVEANWLMDEVVFPVASPAYNGGSLPLEPGDLRAAVLLRHSSQPWEPWFQQARLALVEPDAGPKFSDAAMVIEAAIAGRGIALARGLLVEDDIRHGRLVRLWRYEIVDAHAYYLVWPKGAGRSDKIAEFRLWLLQEVKKSQSAS